MIMLINNNVSHAKNRLMLNSTHFDKEDGEDLVRLWKQNKDVDTLEEIVIFYSRLIHGICRKYTNHISHKLDYDDLFSWGVVGFLFGIERFDVDRDIKFTTFASHYIKGYIQRFVTQEGFTIRLPVHLLETKREVDKLYRKCESDNVEISDEEVCQQLNISSEKLTLIKSVYHNVVQMASTNEYRFSDDSRDTEVEDMILSNEKNSLECILEDEKSERILKYLDTLNKQEQYIVKCRFGFNGDVKTLEELGNEFNVTRERIRQIERKALLKLKRRLVRDNIRDSESF